MQLAPEAASLACPECGGELSSTWQCGACATTYFKVGGLPWLLTEGGLRLQEWKNQAQALVAHFDEKIDGLEEELKASALLESTRERLTRLRKAQIEQKKILAQLLSPLNLPVGKVSADLFTALEVQLPLGQNLLSYDTNLHRDWSWGEEENRLSAERVDQALPLEAGHTAVWGSGGSRLAYDLARKRPQSPFTALDINPLLLLSAKKILEGEALSLYEFPPAPLNLEALLSKNDLRAPAPCPKNLRLLFADVWNPPFKEKSLDAIITPWLLDIVTLPLAGLLERINHVLREGGSWVYFGSLVCRGKGESARILEDELFALMESSGFAVESHQRQEIPYLESPHSSQSRREKTLVVRARKVEHRNFDRAATGLPRWLLDPREAVPLLPFLAGERQVHQIQASVLGLVDGKTSLTQMLPSLQKIYGMGADEGLAALTQFFRRLLEPTL